MLAQAAMRGQQSVISNLSPDKKQISFGIYDDNMAQMIPQNPSSAITGGQPQISFINYNNPTINMNFSGDKQSLGLALQPASQMHDDNDFYDTLNFGTLNGKSATNENSQQINFQNKVQQKVGVTPLNPYQNLSKTVKNANQPMSHEVSLNNTNESVDIEEINGTTTKKKVTKKKIIRKIIKKKNADGSDAPPEITTVVIESKKAKHEQEDDDEGEESKQRFGYRTEIQADRQPVEITQTGVEILKQTSDNQIDQQEERKQPVKKIVKIIKKKKKKANENVEVKIEEEEEKVKQDIEQQQQQLMQQQKEREVFEQEQAREKERQMELERQQQRMREEQQQQLQQKEEVKESKPKVKKIIRKKVVEKPKVEVVEEQKVISNYAGGGVQQKERSKSQINKGVRQSRQELKRRKEKEPSEDQEGEENNEADESEESEDDEQFQKRAAAIRMQEEEMKKQQAVKQQLDQKRQSELMARNMSFRVAILNNESYGNFVHQLIFGQKSRELIMSPIPFNVGQLRFTIERHRSGFNRIHPSYYLYLEKNQGGRVLVLYGKKRTFKRTPNYLISMEKNKGERDADVCLGKLRGNQEGDKYVLYDKGENYTKVNQYSLDKIRNEEGAFIYRYEPCNVGNIRKMIVLLPTLVQTQGQSQNQSSQSLGYDALGNLVLMAQKQWKPIREQDTMIEIFAKEGVRNPNYMVLVDNPPAWNPKTNTYVYDFKGRVTQPSIKNFQLIPELDGRRGQTLQEFILQFGKNGKENFILDAQYPFSIFQAFGLALSAFDTD